MKISIVIPTYNQGQYILDCLESIHKQTYTDLEIIIQDSVSKDQTETICREFVSKDPRFQYFREKDTGQSDAINRGLARSTGKVWTWICSDDYYSDPGALEALMKAFVEKHNQDASFVGIYGDAEYVTEDGKFIDVYHNQTKTLTKSDFKLNWPLSQPSSLIWKDSVDGVNGVDVALHLGMDLDLFLKLLKNGEKLVYVPHRVASVRVQSNSKSVMYRKKTAVTALSIIEKHFGDTGNALESAYVHEHIMSKRRERLEAAKSFVNKIIPIFPSEEVIAKAEGRELTHHDYPVTYRAIRQVYVSSRHYLRKLAKPFSKVYELYLQKKYSSVPLEKKDK